MPLERSRQLIGGVWKYVTAQQTDGGNGGSVPENVSRFNLGVIDIADAIDAPLVLWTPDAGEVGTPYFRIIELSSDSFASAIVFCDEGFMLGFDNDLALSRPLGAHAVGISDDPSATGYAEFAASAITLAISTTGVTAAASITPPALWQANHAFGAFDAIFAAGHRWEADPGGTSGAPEPNWAAGFGGTVADNDISWTDLGEITGSVQVYVDVAVPA